MHFDAAYVNPFLQPGSAMPMDYDYGGGYGGGYGEGGSGMPGTSISSSMSHILEAGVSKLTLTGSANISGTGNSAANGIWGNTGANILSGLGGNDSLYGKIGNDVLVGGLGADELTGGGGADRFDFNSITESKVAHPDLINDLGSMDRIDLKNIDANSTMAGNQAFTFVSGTHFTGTGQIYYDPSDYSLHGDTDGDAGSEFVILVYASGNNPINAADFIL